MGEFHDHYKQKLERRNPLALCDLHVKRNLTVPHEMVNISGMGDECVWCGTEDVHMPADWLVDLTCR